MAIETYNYADLGGGLNQAAAAVLETREMTALENFYPYSTILRTRGGHQNVALVRDAAGIGGNSAFPLKLADGTWVLIVAQSAGFGYIDAGAYVALPNSTATPASLGVSRRPWTLFQYKNNLYGLRPDSGQLVRITSSNYARAGISAPSVGPTITQGAVGALAAGDYYGVYTYYNQETGMESNPSPTSGKLTLGAGRTIDWTGITASLNPFVNARRVYRTVVGQTGMYYFAFQINNNVDTAYAGEQVLPQDLGASVSFNNGLPPAGLETGAIWQERLFASDGTNLYFSEFLQPEMFGTDVLPIFPDDGHVIRGLLAFGDRLIIGKTNAVHYLVGTDPSNFAIHTLSDRHGVMSQHSMKVAESNLFYYGTDRKVYRSDGTYVKDISTPRIADVLASIDADYEQYVCGAIDAVNSWYLLTVPIAQTGTTPIWRTLIYNYKYDTWTQFTGGGRNPNTGVVHGMQYIFNHYDANYQSQLYGLSVSDLFTVNDQNYHYDDSIVPLGWGLGVGQSIPQFTLTTKADDFGAPGYRHFFEEVWMLLPQMANGALQIEALRDGIVTPDINRTVFLNTAPIDGWRAYKVPTGRTPGTKTQLRLTYIGTSLFDLEQLSFRAGLMRRQSQQPR